LTEAEVYVELKALAQAEVELEAMAQASLDSHVLGYIKCNKMKC
jgi:hypothetical protein